MPQALEGYRVLEAGRFFAGPCAGMLLGDMGAEVIRYEEPEYGDPLRRGYQPLIDGVGPYFLWSARNKKSITLNLRMPQGQDIFKELVKISDVVIENFTPGTMAGWGLDYEQLRKINPKLIMLSISMYGQTGPYSSRPGVDYLAQASSGLMYLTGDPGGPSTLHGVAISDYVGGFMNAYAILSAMVYREKTGIGQYIDNSLFESSAFFNENKILHYTKLGLVTEKKSAIGVGILSRTYKCKDGEAYIIGNAQKRQEILTIIGRPDLLEDPRFAGSRYSPMGEEGQIEMARLIEEWAKDKTRAEVINALVAEEIQAAPVNNVADVVNDPQYIARGALVEVEHPVLGTLKIQGPVPKMSVTPPEVHSPPPLLGQHNDYVYRELLKMTEEQIEEMKAIGVI